MKQRPGPHAVLLCVLAACASSPHDVPERWLDDERPRPHVAPEIRADEVETPRRAAPLEDTLEAQLARTVVPSFQVEDEESLRAVAAALRGVTGLPLIVTDLAEFAALDFGAVFELDLEHPLSARNVLNLITEQAGDEVTWILRHDAILITTKEQALSGHVLQAYDVRALTAARTDFRGPRIDRLRDADADEEALGGVVNTGPTLEEDELLALLRDNVAPASWDHPDAGLVSEGGLLYVRNTPDVQAQVRHFLTRLGAF